MSTFEVAPCKSANFTNFCRCKIFLVGEHSQEESWIVTVLLFASKRDIVVSHVKRRFIFRRFEDGYAHTESAWHSANAQGWSSCKCCFLTIIAYTQLLWILARLRWWFPRKDTRGDWLVFSCLLWAFSRISENLRFKNQNTIDLKLCQKYVIHFFLYQIWSLNNKKRLSDDQD